MSGDEKAFARAGDHSKDQTGMDLIDWFAGQALVGVVNAAELDRGVTLTVDDIAHDAYMIANAMMRRKKETA